MTAPGSKDREAPWAPTTPFPPAFPFEADTPAEGTTALAGDSTLVRRLIRVLFGVVAVLLLADLHSSLAATHDRWEINPLIDLLAEHIGIAGALLCTKAVDLTMLAALYALWRKSKADIAVGLALAIAAFEYAQIVSTNYQG